MNSLILWVVMAGVAAGVTAVILIPLFRGRTGVDSGSAERAIYRDQLEELEREVERGLIGPSEAEAARVEIARRVMHLETRSDAAAAGVRAGRLRLAGAGILLAPLAAFGLYVLLGSPNLPDNPQAARIDTPVEEADMATLIGRVEQHLADNPDDGRGWEVVAPIYARFGRFDDAAEAFAQALRVLGPTAAREANVGEALVWANGGLIVEPARDAFTRALELDPANIRARFYLARALEQDGRDDEAVEAWRALLDDAPPEAAWTAAARASLTELETRLGLAPSGPAQPPGPTAEDMAAAQELTVEEREDMIVGMVEGLAARLEDEPGDVDGWTRLIRSYVVLDQRDQAVGALGRARVALVDDEAGLAAVDAMARELGLQDATEPAQ